MSQHAATTDSAHAAHHAPGEPHHHVPSWQFMTGIFVALLFLTLLTVYTALQIDLGDTGNLLVAIVIAVLKGALVVGFFMHLHWDKKINAVILLYCLLAMFTFFVFTVIDLGSRDAIDPVRAQVIAPTIVEEAKAAATHNEGGEGSPEGEAEAGAAGH